MYNDSYVNDSLAREESLKTFSGVAILGEQRGGKVSSVTYELLTWGRTLADKLNQPLWCFLTGAELANIDDLLCRGADEVHFVKNDILRDNLARPMAKAVCQVTARLKPAIIIGAASTIGRTVMPLVAAALETGLTADCTGLDIDATTGLLLQTRPAIGGNIMATIKTPEHRPQMATVRPRSAKAAGKCNKRARLCEYELLGTSDYRERFIKFVRDMSQSVSIEEADVIVAGGKGLKSAEGFKLIHELADALHAAVGASREAVELGWVGYPHQIGLSGKTVCPKLLIACGISGKIQFLAGMQTAETVIAINRDPDAQIFKVADYGIVGDVFDILPDLIAEIKAREAR